MLWILRITQGREKEESFRRFFTGQNWKSGLQYSVLDSVIWSHLFGKTGKYGPSEWQKESNMLLVMVPATYMYVYIIAMSYSQSKGLNYRKITS